MTTVTTNDGTPIMSNANRRKPRYAPQRRLIVAALLLSIVAPGYADGPTSSEAAVVTFGVAGETFRMQFVGERQIEAARAAQGGGSHPSPQR
jgi:hypothetical protein